MQKLVREWCNGYLLGCDQQCKKSEDLIQWEKGMFSQQLLLKKKKWWLLKHNSSLSMSYQMCKLVMLWNMKLEWHMFIGENRMMYISTI